MEHGKEHYRSIESAFSLKKTGLNVNAPVPLSSWGGTDPRQRNYFKALVYNKSVGSTGKKIIQKVQTLRKCFSSGLPRVNMPHVHQPKQKPGSVFILFKR
jgi:hypothetical protein